MTTLFVNGERVKVEKPPGTLLLWVLREHMKLTGTKHACGAGLCGACTVHINGEAALSCVTTLAAVDGKKVTTIEGLSPDSSHPLQLAWISEQVPQCGYCQSGQIMKAATLLSSNKNPSKNEIVQHMNSILCRCGTYSRIIAAIERAAGDT